MFRSYYWIFHFVMISIGAYFLADMASLVLGSYLEESVEILDRPTSISVDNAALDTKKGRHDYRSILERNIFNSRPSKSTQGNKGQSISELTATPVSLPPLNLILVGTVVSKDAPAFAVFKERKQKDQTIYRQGDIIGENAKILEIDRNKTVVERGGKKEIIHLTVAPDKKQRNARPLARRVSPTSSLPSVGKSIRQLSNDQWLLDRREIDNAMKNLPELLTKARIIPNFKDGKPDGFRIFAIAKGSLYSKIGLQNGDILNRINGVEVKDPQNFMKVLEQLKDENNIHIDLVRNNKKQTFNYDIR